MRVVHIRTYAEIGLQKRSAYKISIIFFNEIWNFSPNLIRCGQNRTTRDGSNFMDLRPLYSLKADIFILFARTSANSQKEKFAQLYVKLFLLTVAVLIS